MSQELIIPPWLGAKLADIFGSLEDAQAWYGIKLTVAERWNEEAPCVGEVTQGARTQRRRRRGA